LDAPRDGDRSSREDGMIAEVIPLRRRTPEHGSSSEERSPAHSGVFDPPPDPEPPEEYSVWERPTAELLRRDRADHLVPSNGGRRRWAEAVLSRRAHAAAMLATLIATVTFIIVTSSSHRAPHTLASPGPSRVQAGLGLPLGAAPPSALRPQVRRYTRRAKRAPTHRATTPTGAFAASRTTSEPVVASPPPVAPSSVGSHVSTPTVASQPATPTVASQPATQSHREVPTATTASREFGFEQ
jgi:hypothetical protein